MRHLAFWFRGDSDLEIIRDVLKKFGFPESTICKNFVEDEPLMSAGRPALDKAKKWARENGCAIVVVDLQGQGRTEPLIHALVEGGVPLYFPQVPTMPQGKPLDLEGIRELRAWNDRMKSLMMSQAAVPGRGGDQGYKPPPESTANAREGRQVAADETAEDRSMECILAYTDTGSFNAAAKDLNERGIPTPSGTGEWYGSTVRRLLKRMGAV